LKIFHYDISSLTSRGAINLDKVTFAGTLEMLRDAQAVAARTGATPGAVMAELHGRFTGALMCIVAALVGFATLLAGAFSRFGTWRQVLVAFGLLVGLKVIESAVLAPVLVTAALWPLLYAPSVGGLGLAAGLLWLAQRPGLWRRMTRALPWNRAAAGAQA